MTEDRQKLISQIKKMYALAGNNPSKEEAEQAMIMAQNLMAKHDLSQKDIAFESEPEVCDVSVEGDDRKNIPYWQKPLVSVLAKNLKCSYYFQWEETKWVIKIVGLEGDVEICLDTVNFAFSHYQRSWDDFMKYVLAADVYSTRTKTNARKNDFTKGFVMGVEEAFEKNVEEKGLIIVQPEAVTARIKSLKLRAEKRSERSSAGDAEAVMSGYVAGLNSKKPNAEAIAEDAK